MDKDVTQREGLFEVRFHGRGGQGTVVASVLLAEAAFKEGCEVQAFPFFGVERRGAPVVAHTRIGRRTPVRLACDVAAPDAVLVMDPTLVAGLGRRLLAGLKPGGLLLVNTKKPPQALAIRDANVRIATLDAASIARGLGLGSSATPIVNTAMLGGLVRASGVVSPSSLHEAIRSKVPARIQQNVDAAVAGAQGVLA